MSNSPTVKLSSLNRGDKFLTLNDNVGQVIGPDLSGNVSVDFHGVNLYGKRLVRGGLEVYALDPAAASVDAIAGGDNA